MRKMMTYTLAALMSLPVFPTLASCDDDDDDEVVEEEVKPDPDQGEGSGGGGLQVPPEVVAKIEEIYDKASIEPQTVTTVHQLAILTSLCASRDGDGPITVTPARLNGKDITLVTLGGTEMVEGQATTLKESQLASFGMPNDYLRALTGLFENGTVPADRPVMVTGISLGGMIAQQLLGCEDIMEKYDICNIVTFGSPINLPLDRHGVKVVRFADAHDQVPQMGESLLRSGLVTAGQMSKAELHEILDVLDRNEKIVRSGKYSEMIETHALSYIEDECWNDIDFLGDSAHHNVLELMATMKFYDAPKLSK